MESRVERYRKLKSSKKHRRIKFLAIIICVLFFFTCLYRVDNTLRNIMCIYDKAIYRFEAEHEVYRLHLLGKDYIVDKEQIDYQLDKIITKAKRIVYIVNDYKDKLFNY